MNLTVPAEYNVFRLQPVNNTLDIVSCFGADVMDESPNDEEREWNTPISLNQFFSCLNNLRIAWTGFPAHNIEICFNNSDGIDFLVEVRANVGKDEAEYAYLYSFVDGVKEVYYNEPFAYYDDVPLRMDSFGQIFEQIGNKLEEMQLHSQREIDEKYDILAYDGFEW